MTVLYDNKLYKKYVKNNSIKKNLINSIIFSIIILFSFLFYLKSWFF